MKPLAILALLLLSCGRGNEEEPVRAQGLVVRPPHDTTRLSLPATARRCNDGRSLLLQAASPSGSGVLVRLKYVDTLASGTYPVVWPGDTASRRGAMVAVRYIVREAPYSVAMDSGEVEVQVRRAKTLTAHVAGRGVENTMRVFAAVDFRDVPIEADTASCRYQQ